MIGGIYYTPFSIDSNSESEWTLPFPTYNGVVNLPNPDSFVKIKLDPETAPAEDVITPARIDTSTVPIGDPIVLNIPTEDHITVTQPIVDQVMSTPMGKHVFKYNNMNVGHMQALLDEAAKYGISFRVTSGVRPGAKTKSGNVSWHASGNAIDVTPIAGQTYEDLKQAIRNNPAFVKWMQDHGYGIYEETTPGVMAKTGATGKHWHIGKDKVAIRGLQEMIS